MQNSSCQCGKMGWMGEAAPPACSRCTSCGSGPDGQKPKAHNTETREAHYRFKNEEDGVLCKVTKCVDCHEIQIVERLPPKPFKKNG